MTIGVQRPWTKREVNQAITLRNAGRTSTQIGAVIRRSAKAVELRLHAEGVRSVSRRPGLIPTIPLGPDGKPKSAVEVERERIENRRLVRAEREDIMAVASERSLRAEITRVIRDVARQIDAPPRWKAPNARSKTASVETAVQMFSDWHSDEVVLSEAVRGFNEYNDTIAAQRVRAVVDRHLSIKGRMEAGGGWRIPHLVVSANGDFVSGTIHELEKHSDHKNVVWAVYETGLRLGQAIRDLSAAYEHVEVVCTSGNHGRLPDARRIQEKEPTRNWDTLVYLFAKEATRSLSNVTWTIPDSYSLLFQVGRWTFGQQHGHEVRSWNSVPFYGLNRLTGNLNAMEAARGAQIHYWLFGHFHSASSMPHASGESFINGSLIGATEFSVNALGKADRPTQWLMFVHPENGVTSRWPLLGEAVAPRRPVATA
jgi:hypothetical protein